MMAKCQFPDCTKDATKRIARFATHKEAKQSEVGNDQQASWDGAVFMLSCEDHVEELKKDLSPDPDMS